MSGLKGKQLEQKQRVEKAKETRKHKNIKGKPNKRETIDDR